MDHPKLPPVTVTRIKQSPISPAPLSTGASVDSAHSRLRRLTPNKLPAKRLHKAPTKLKAASTAVLKPLVPKTERVVHDSLGLGRKNSEAENVIEGGSLRKRGLAVANVGNGGKIYLRPTILPANERYPTQTNVFPVTPPSTAGLDALPSSGTAATPAAKTMEITPEPSPSNSHQMKLTIKPLSDKPTTEQSSDLHLSQWDDVLSPPPISPPKTPPSILTRNFSRGTTYKGHRRALSDGTMVPETLMSPMGGNVMGELKIVIDKHNDERPRTAEGDQPFLNVSIPSHRIGLPRFTTRGTPIIRTSYYTATEDLQSSVGVSLSAMPTSVARTSYMTQSPGPYVSGASREPTWMIQTPWRFLPEAPLVPVPAIPAHHLANGLSVTPGSPLRADFTNDKAMRMTYMSAHQVIEPSMFDALTFKPACDNRAIVRYATNSAVTAATPPRLVAEITSASFLDYELLSDFFLTFRGFLEPMDLLKMLIARFRWAAARSDETGMVVRVRTFVALRHWILNYFVDDFLEDFDLRVQFCELVNELIRDLEKIGNEAKPHIKIVNELKKCWRRICLQFWEGSGSDNEPITPGSPPFFDPEGSYTDDFELRQSMGTLGREPSNVPSLANSTPGDATVNSRPDTPPLQPLRPLQQQQQQTQHGQGQQQYMPKHGLNLMSVSSIDVVSCSFPTGKNLQRLGLSSAGFHTNPIRPTTAAEKAVLSSGGIATTPKGVVGKRVRPTHKRNGSVSDSLRDHNDWKISEQSADCSVFGLAPPEQAFFEGDAGTDTEQAKEVDTNPCIHAAPGVKKILCTVKRALNTHCHNIHLAGAGSNVSKMATGAPSSAVVPQVHDKKITERPGIRIDVLGARIADKFKRIIEEEEGLSCSPRSPLHPAEETTFQTAHLDGSFEDISRVVERAEQAVSAAEQEAFGLSGRRRTHHRGMSDGAITAITTGSKSIMIINDTRLMPFDLSTMPVPGVNPSVEAFAQNFLEDRLSVLKTPHRSDSPRQSSFLLNDALFFRPLTESANLPPFIPDLAGLLDGGCLSPNEAFRSPQTMTFPKALEVNLGDNSGFSGIFDHDQLAGSRPVSDSGETVMQERRSIISQVSSQVSQRRNSLQERKSFAPSFISSVVSSISNRPLPARMLRRRPAGNLRDIETVEQLENTFGAAGSHTSMARSRSMTTIGTFTDSLRSSYVQLSYVPSTAVSQLDHDAVSPSTSEPAPSTFSLGALANRSPILKKKLSLFSTHSSLHPGMCPSFEAELQKLAAIPDDTDGGVETALMKLEGRYEAERATTPVMDMPQGAPRLRKQMVTLNRVQGKKHVNRNIGIGGDRLVGPTMKSETSLEDNEGSFDSFLPAGPMRRYLGDDHSRPSVSGDSYVSMPQLERLSTDKDSTLLSPSRDWMDQSILTIGDDESIQPLVLSAKPSNINMEIGVSTPRIRISGSFLNDGSDNGYEPPALELAVPESLGDMAMDMAAMAGMEQEYNATGKTFSPISPVDLKDKPLPPTPAPTSPGLPKTPTDEALHLPFILAFDSTVLATQFLLIERSFLLDITWKDLTSLEWKDTPLFSSWLTFLRTSTATGVSAVIARFNIVVSWVISEIVLTKSLHERARCISKFIHVAEKSKGLRNFATVAQITMALTSPQVTSLSKTWSLVPFLDLSTLRNLENLLSPTRNFYVLRATQETDGVPCIPFLGIYTHDLLFNAQRPNEVASSPTGIPLVNFERCRKAAGVVRTVLRLVEGGESMSEGKEGVEGIWGRCLWVGGLERDEIEERVKGLVQEERR